MSAAAVETEATAAPKKSMMPKLMVGGFVSMVVIAETLIFFLMVPSADDVAALAEHRLRERLEEKMKAADKDVVDDSQSIEEFRFGDPFSLTFIPNGTESNYRADFILFATVKKKDLSRLEELYKTHENRFRHRVALEIRNATIDEMKDSQLGLIQRRVLATTNEILEEPIVLGVGFRDYQFYEE
jgi:hypothetical protein